MQLRMMSMSAACILLWMATDAARGELANKIETLRGHQSVFVSVSTPQSEDAIRRLGLVKASLERYIIARLADAKIPASLEFTDQTLILEIQVDVHKVAQGNQLDVFAFVSQFDAIQAARLAANRQAALAATWRATQFGAVTSEQAHLLRESVVSNLDNFIRDWQTAQTAESGSP
jgi:hypothetical protein